MKNIAPQALFFDFDGVLVDSNSIKADAFRALFADYNAETVGDIVGYHKQHGGVSRVEKIQYAFRHIIKQPLSDDELLRRSRAYSELVVDKVVEVPWIDGAKDFLNRIHGALPIFVISGTPQDELRHIIDRRKMTGYFQEILGSPTRKPEHIRNLLACYQLVPGHCVFIGDALTDYHAARQTGLHFVGIQGEVTFPEKTIVLPDCRGLHGAIRQYFFR